MTPEPAAVQKMREKVRERTPAEIVQWMREQPTVDQAVQILATYAAAQREEVERERDRIDEKYDRLVNDALPRQMQLAEAKVDALQAALAQARAAMHEVVTSGREFDDERLDYIVVQIPRALMEELAALTAAQARAGQ